MITAAPGYNNNPQTIIKLKNILIQITQSGKRDGHHQPAEQADKVINLKNEMSTNIEH